MDIVDTLWVLGSAALVLFVTPGLTLSGGGMFRSKNVLAITTISLTTLGCSWCSRCWRPVRWHSDMT